MVHDDRVNHLSAGKGKRGSTNIFMVFTEVFPLTIIDDARIYQEAREL